LTRSRRGADDKITRNSSAPAESLRSWCGAAAGTRTASPGAERLLVIIEPDGGHALQEVIELLDGAVQVPALRAARRHALLHYVHARLVGQGPALTGVPDVPRRDGLVDHVLSFPAATCPRTLRVASEVVGGYFCDG
jgi:hypothetical protein